MNKYAVFFCEFVSLVCVSVFRRKAFLLLFPFLAAEIVFPVTLRFLIRAETVRFLRNLFHGYSEGDVPVNGYRVRYILVDDSSVRTCVRKR